MKREMKLVAVATAVAMLAGCASGGDTLGNDVIGDNPLELLLCAPLFICGAKKSTSSARTSSSTGSSTTSAPSSTASYSALGPSAPATFESWSTFPRNTTGEAPGVETYVSYEGRISSVYVRPGDTQWLEAGFERFKYDAQGNLVVYSPIVANPITPLPNLSNIGHPGIDVGLDRILSNFPQSPFTTVTGSAVGVIANPYALGWDYQSFGAWNSQASGGDGGVVFAQSFGAATPASAVPLSGTASFVGKLGGLYVSPAGEGSIAAADVTVNADFNTRSLSFASSNTVITRDLATATPAPGLNLSGTLSYSPGSPRFRGTLTSAGGTMSGTSNGQFYGPQAEELGGILVVKSATTVETLTGAYGAKR